MGVSSCLLGEEVRFNGGHKRYRFLTDSLDPYVDWVPYCPEMEIGLGTPREAIRLTAGGRLVNRGGTADHTAAMAALPLPADLDGYVFKAKSPSCGIRAILRYRDDGQRDDGRAAGTGPGLYASRVLSAFPLLAVEDEGRLNDPGLREEFVERIFAAARLRSFLGGPWSAGDLVAFHARHKLQMLAHDPLRYRAAGRVVAAAGCAARLKAQAYGCVPGRDGGLRPLAAATPTRCSTPTAGSAGNSTGRGATTWWPGSRPTGAARSRSACRSHCSPTTPWTCPGWPSRPTSGPSPRICACATPFRRERDEAAGPRDVVGVLGAVGHPAFGEALARTAGQQEGHRRRPDDGQRSAQEPRLISNRPHHMRKSPK